MKNIKCDQREQSLGQKALLDNDCTCSLFWDQCQEVTQVKEQSRSTQEEKEGRSYH